MIDFSDDEIKTEYRLRNLGEEDDCIFCNSSALKNELEGRGFLVYDPDESPETLIRLINAINEGRDMKFEIRAYLEEASGRLITGNI